MAKHYRGQSNMCLRYYMDKRGYTASDLGRALQLSKPTLYKYLNEPILMTLGELLILAGMFGISIEELVYAIQRNKPKVNKAGKWYLDGERVKGDKVNSSEG